jgi:hypothetical protein
MCRPRFIDELVKLGIVNFRAGAKQFLKGFGASGMRNRQVLLHEFLDVFFGGQSKALRFLGDLAELLAGKTSNVDIGGD